MEYTNHLSTTIRYPSLSSKPSTVLDLLCRIIRHHRDYRYNIPFQQRPKSDISLALRHHLTTRLDFPTTSEQSRIPPPPSRLIISAPRARLPTLAPFRASITPPTPPSLPSRSPLSKPLMPLIRPLLRRRRRLVLGQQLERVLDRRDGRDAVLACARRGGAQDHERVRGVLLLEAVGCRGGGEEGVGGVGGGFEVEAAGRGVSVEGADGG